MGSRVTLRKRAAGGRVRKSSILKGEGGGMEGEEKGYVLGNYSKSSRWKGGRHLKAKGGLEVETAQGAGNGIGGYCCSEVIKQLQGFFITVVLFLPDCVASEAAQRA